MTHKYILIHKKQMCKEQLYKIATNTNLSLVGGR